MQENKYALLDSLIHSNNSGWWENYRRQLRHSIIMRAILVTVLGLEGLALIATGILLISQYVSGLM